VYTGNVCKECVDGWKWGNSQCLLMEKRMRAVPTRFRVKSGTRGISGRVLQVD
jgi:hypothetical protein